MPMVDVTTAVATSLAVSTLFYMVVIPLLPSRIRERVSWWAASLRKYVLSPTVSMEMVSKASAGDGQAEPAGEVLERAAGRMRSAGLDVTSNDLSLRSPVMVGMQEMSLSVRLISDDNGAFEQAEIVVGAKCRYRDFERCIVEMREAQIRAKEAMSEAGMTPDRTFCIVCKLKSLPQAKTILGSIDADMMSYSTPNGQAFDLYGNKIEYYDTEVHRGMMSLLKKMLVAHA